MSNKLILSGASCVFGILAMVSVIHHGAGIEPNVSSTASCTDQFPAPVHCLAKVRDTKDCLSRLHHAWRLLERFGQDTALQEDVKSTPDVIVHLHPAWERWSTKCSLQLSTKLNCPSEEAEPSKNRLVAERRVQKTVSEDTKNSGPPPYSSVYYNHGARDWILSQHLNSGAGLFKILTNGINGGSGAPTMIPAARHPDSAVVKEIWVVVSPDPSGAWNVPVYDPTIKPDPVTLSLHNVYEWNSKVTLKLAQDQSVLLLDTTSDCQFPSASNTVTANCFVYRYAPKKCSSIRDPFNGPAVVDPHLPEDGPCIFLLLGVQIITQESLPNWSWNTYWWTEKPNATPDASGWDANAPKGFKHFEMDTMLSLDSISAPANARPIFNPFLEGPMSNGTATNCLLCHSQASYIPNVDGQPVSNRNGKPLHNARVNLIQDQPIQHLYKDCTPEERKQPATNNCRLRTGLLWSLATNQDPSAQASN